MWIKLACLDPGTKLPELAAHALRLCHIDFLREMPIEKHIIYIKLAKSPLAIERNARHSTDGDEVYHGTESLVKVNARLLVKAFSNKANFILCNRAVRISLEVVAHYILPQSWGNQSPSIVLDKSIIFVLHRLNPLGILESLGDSAGFTDS